MVAERVQKILAAAGVASRRAVEEMIRDGRITINGQVALLGDRADAETDEIAVDSIPVATRPGLVHYLLNKPAGVISSASDPHDRPIVTDLVPADPRVHPVGRLDADTEGLLLLTNDGVLTHRLTHPSFGVEKEYLAHVQGHPSRGALRRLRQGIDLDDGPTAPAQVSLIEPSLLRMVIHEGRNRQVRRMLDAVGHAVERLVRTRIGPIRLQQLRPGAWRQLTTEELRALERATGTDSAVDETPRQ